MIGAADLVWSDEAVAPADGLGDADQAIGKAARRPLRAGAAAALHDLAAPKAFKRDQAVSVAFEEDGVSLTLEARALADAAVGDPVQLVNPLSKKVIDAVASGPGEAVVGVRAERLRAAPGALAFNQ